MILSLSVVWLADCGIGLIHLGQHVGALLSLQRLLNRTSDLLPHACSTRSPIWGVEIIGCQATWTEHARLTRHVAVAVHCPLFGFP
jgi:hypothetical protein